MKFKEYIKDQWYKILLFIIMYSIILLILCAFKVSKQAITAISLVLLLFFISSLLIDFYRKKTFYTMLLLNIERLDKSYLVLETLEKPHFYEGELLYQALYRTNKSMNENIYQKEEQWQDLKNYIEMWIHEIKIPLASAMLMSDHQDTSNIKIKKELKRLEAYVDQVLYYIRSEYAEKDYLIKQTLLSNVVKNVGLKYMDALLAYQIDYVVENVNVLVLSDSKWLEFIIGQVIDNSIKYRKKEANAYIKITAYDEQDKVTLTIEDNGIGIQEADIKQVFHKSFTGNNGRKGKQSTGMGLFIAKNMCAKLGHQIYIESKENIYTKVVIVFIKNHYYEVVK